MKYVAFRPAIPGLGSAQNGWSGPRYSFVVRR